MLDFFHVHVYKISPIIVDPSRQVFAYTTDGRITLWHIYLITCSRVIVRASMRCVGSCCHLLVNSTAIGHCISHVGTFCRKTYAEMWYTFSTWISHRKKPLHQFHDLSTSYRRSGPMWRLAMDQPLFIAGRAIVPHTPTSGPFCKTSTSLPRETTTFLLLAIQK